MLLANPDQAVTRVNADLSNGNGEKLYEYCIYPQISIPSNVLTLIIEHSENKPVIIDGLNFTTNTADLPGLIIKSPVILRNLTLTGSNALGSTGIVIESDGVEIIDSDVVGFDVGIQLVADGTRLSDVTVVGAGEGKSLLGIEVLGSDVVLENVSTSNSATGIRVLGNDVEILGGTLQQHERGVQIAPMLGDQASLQYVIAPARIESVQDPIVSVHEVATSRLEALQFAKRCVEVELVDGVERCVELEQGNKVEAMVSVLPESLCAETAIVPEIHVYHHAMLVADSSPVFTHRGQCAISATTQPMRIARGDDVVVHEVGTCAAMCQFSTDSEQSLWINDTVQLLVQDGAALSFSNELRMRLRDLDDVDFPTLLAPLGDLQSPIVAGFSQTNSVEAAAPSGGEAAAVPTPIFETAIGESDVDAVEVDGETATVASDEVPTGPFIVRDTKKEAAAPGVVGGCSLIIQQ